MVPTRGEHFIGFWVQCIKLLIYHPEDSYYEKCTVLYCRDKMLS